MLPGNILTAQARSGMALGHTGAVLSKTIAAQQCGAKHTVAYIRLVAMTLYAGSVTHENADVVEHRGLFYRRLIKAKLFPAVDLKAPDRPPNGSGPCKYPEGSRLRDNICQSFPAMSWLSVVD